MPVCAAKNSAAARRRAAALMARASEGLREARSGEPGPAMSVGDGTRCAGGAGGENANSGDGGCSSWGSPSGLSGISTCVR